MWENLKVLLQHPLILLPASHGHPCRSQFRRQKRWWSAYLLFYERKDFSDSHDGPTDSKG